MCQVSSYSVTLCSDSHRSSVFSCYYCSSLQSPSHSVSKLHQLHMNYNKSFYFCPSQKFSLANISLYFVYLSQHCKKNQLFSICLHIIPENNLMPCCIFALKTIGWLPQEVSSNQNQFQFHFSQSIALLWKSVIHL